MSDLAHRIAEALLDSEAFKFSVDPLFTWSSGIQSPVYCDLRALNGNVEARRMIVDGFCELMPKDVEVIAGTATAGISWAAWVAEKLNLPMVYVRGTSKAHGMGRRVEGNIPSGKRVVVIEDLVSTGGSSASTVEGLRHDVDAVVEHVFSINTYMISSADELFSQLGVALTSLTNYQVILEVALAQGAVTEREAEMLKDFTQDPSTWAERKGLIKSLTS